MFFSRHSLIFFSLLESVCSLGLQVARDKWVITADSQHAGNEARKAIDGDPNTFWHSEYQPNAALPHNVVIDMAQLLLVDGISLLPRQDNTNNGNVGQHIIELSRDGKTWGHPVAVGTFQNTKDTKKVSFVRQIARYVRMTAITEAQGANNPWTSIAEFNVHRVADPYLDPTGWTITADSEETAAQNNRAVQVTDGLPYTIWHTEWSQRAPAHPHTLTINQNKQQLVSGLLYTPRQGIGNINNPENGRVGFYVIQTSNDGQNWKIVAQGKWADDDTDKAAFWPAASVRYVRLNALSEAGNRGPWTSAGDIQLMYGSVFSTWKAYNPRLGLWSHTMNFPLVPAAAANMYSTDQVLTWSAFANDQFFQANQGKTQVALWNSTSDAMTNQEVANTQHDMFCPGVSMDSTGRFIVTGGNDAKRTSIYDPRTNEWLRAADMNIPRGYQSQTTLSDGRIFTIGGSWSGGDHNDKDGEIYDIKTDTWTNLPGCKVAPSMTHDKGGRYRADNHQWLFSWKDNNVFHAGPSDQMVWFDTKHDGKTFLAGHRGDGDSMNGVAVMYDAMAGKIYTSGGAPNYQTDHAHNHAAVLTINEPGHEPTVEKVGDMNSARGFHTGVALPDGTIVVFGGQTFVEPFTDTYAVRTPELFDPKTKTHTLLNPQSAPRTYHSVSLLLKDGSVFSAGGGLCGNCATNHFDGEVFLPPYLLNTDGTPKTRPSITSVSGDTFSLGSQINVKSDAAMSSIALMRLGSATHTVNTDQRRIPFAVSGTDATITIPDDAGIALPGYYYLFVLNQQGTPSVARTIQITFKQETPADSQELPTLQVLHTMPEPPPETSITDFLNVQNLTQLLDPVLDPAVGGTPPPEQAKVHIVSNLVGDVLGSVTSVLARRRRSFAFGDVSQWLD